MKTNFFAAALFPLLLLGGCAAKPLAAPTAYQEFVAVDKSFAGVGPAGWDKQEFGGGDTYAKTAWTSGGATIEVKSDTATSFLGDAARASGRKPVDAVQDYALAQIARNKGDGFTPQTTQTVQGAFGDSRYTEWTQNGTHGVRITTMMPDRSLSLGAECPEADWTVIKDVAWKVWSGLKAAKQ